MGDWARDCAGHLSVQGGLCVDADDEMTAGDWPILYGNDNLKLQPLSSDLPSQSMMAVAGFWPFHEPTPVVPTT